MDNDNGGSAFPATLEYIIGYQDNGVPIYGKDSYPGMTLRDYFAAQAMQGFLASSTMFDQSDPVVSTYAYRMADAMLAERNKI
ncbi:MAG: hypothetical protein IPJ55_17045 [Chloracidobacterium sp.]|nr:hypothetical protein [Chloracidobacterium sp.]